MANQAPLEAVVSHWSTLIEGFQSSPLAFYEALDAALKRRDIPATKNERIDYREAGMLSANREYLHITRETLVFDICAAPFGTGFFVSWWLADYQKGLHPAARVGIAFLMALITLWLWTKAGLFVWLLLVAMALFGIPVALDEMVRNKTISEGVARTIPIIGTIYTWMFRPASYFRMDSMEMFQKAVHNAVLEVIDTMTAEKGLRALSDTDRKPVMREFYTKRA